MPRINFVSFTFLFAFGLGSFAGIAMALLAVALARPADKTTVIEPEARIAVTATPPPTATATVTPVPSPTPVPPPRTLSTLQVHIGPNEQYAVLGTLARGNEVDVLGRDDEGDWLAIEFPPGSSARGWIPANKVGGLNTVQVFRLEVLQASLVETRLATPTPSLFDGNDGLPGLDTSTPTPVSTRSTTPTVPGTPGTPTRTPMPSPTPPALFGPTDLAVIGTSVTFDGGVQVSVVNQGRGDVPSLTVVVSPVGFAAETIPYGLLRSGQSAVLTTSRIRLVSPTQVTVTIQPGGDVSDVDSSNNNQSLLLTP